MKKPAILIVEDDPVLLRILCKIVENGGYTALPAMNAVDAFETLKDEIPELILEDISLPDLNGVELIHCIRNIPGFENIPVVFVSASSSRITAVRDLNNILTNYLVKPLRPAELLLVIDEMLQLTTQKAG